LSSWAIASLKSVLEGVHCVLNSDGFQWKVKNVDTVEGDAQFIVARGKSKHVCDLSANVNWTIMDGNSTVCYEGTSRVEDITADIECVNDIEISWRWQTIQAASGVVVTQTEKQVNTLLREAVLMFIKELHAK
jgi:activator of HSP90 ATPase